MRRHRTLFVVTGALALSSAPCWSQVTTRGSVASSGAEGGAGSFFPALSDDGQFLAFTSLAANLVNGDTNAAEDVFVRDLVSGATGRVSVASSGVQGGGDSVSPTLSADGRYAAFSSFATNLVSGDTNGVSDVFVHDRQTGATVRASVDSAGVEGNAESTVPMLSSDGLFVVFRSEATNLVSGDTNAKFDIFVHALQTGLTERVSVDSAGVQGDASSNSPAISSDGRYVAFHSAATNLVASDTNGKQDVFVHDRQANTTELASLDSSAGQGNASSVRPALSADGRHVAFESAATDLVTGDTNGVDDVFVRDRQNATTVRVSVDSSGVQGNGTSLDPALSSNGRYVAYYSLATNLVSGDTNTVADIFLRDLQTSTTERASINTLLAQGDDLSDSPSVSSNGRQVAFHSTATNLVTNDTNLEGDDFVRDRLSCMPAVASYCTAKTNSSGCVPFMSWTGNPSVSAGSGFLIDGEQVYAGKAGLLFYSTLGPGGSPFQGGFLCATVPVKRTPLQTSSAAGSPPCTGVHSYDFNARIASGLDPALVLGQPVWSQYWVRDSGAASGTGLTNGLTFMICL